MQHTFRTRSTRLLAAFGALALAVTIPVATAPAAQALTPSSLLLDLTNDYRASKGLSALHWNTGAAKVAQTWSEKMLAEGRMYHNPNVFSQIPSGWTGAAENVGFACGYSSAAAAAKAIMKAWIASSGHEKNLRGSYTDIGIGFAWDSSTRCAYTTQDFAKYSGTPSTYSIFGTVKNSSGGAAANVKVYARKGTSTYTATTDSTGSYSLTGLPKGTYTLQFSPASTSQRGEFYTDATAKACASRISLSKDKVGLTTKLSSSSAPTVDGEVLICDIAADKSSTYYSAFADEIQWLADEGVTTGWDNGYGAKVYKPLSSVTREAMAAFMYRLAGSPKITGSDNFVDISGTAFEDEITWLAGQGITNGWSNGDGTADFQPKSKISREAMAAFLYRYAGSPSYTAPSTSPFVDVKPSSMFYKEICWLASTGISTGWSLSNGKKEYRPSSSITRDAMAAFLSRFDAKGL
ncbi:S-layer homology domain-containing protein [Demequina sp. SYSU T00039]|uniref:S-layer homology domain-containing protein n=1 Tax=Demequina lignilytica TaxID=3051663 RepID=A0AAW7M155_9MICO|nr:MULTISPECIES: S-layer homology domain-containing protein [unclassified Demequina]MDN4478449.1 S-layer homology domain-containing protein [Demequina sp. SYSU T00039-1]MDN4487044.1 S-layer homology domain-containing protein [Demequina sp. SYSU T00039]MDN4489755.1 S-layer homology domain-containing protein [Demequina sp. SYSU T00068]